MKNGFEKEKLEQELKKAKAVSYQLAQTTTQEKNLMLSCIAQGLRKNKDKIIKANKIDLKKAKENNLSSSFIDRLTLTPERIDQMALGVEEVIKLEDPVGQVVDSWKAPSSGIRIKKVRSPLGIIAVIYEARPNVTVDVAALCIKSGNVVVLKGGSDALATNNMLYQIMRDELVANKFSPNILVFINNENREATKEMLKYSQYIDVIIPRGGEGLKRFILANSNIPVIASAGGNCHIYIDDTAKLKWVKDIVFNAKMQRPGVCNAVEHLLIDRKFAQENLKKTLKPLVDKGCVIYGDKEANKIYNKIQFVDDEKIYDTEFLDYKLTVRVIDSKVEGAVDIINQHSTHHSDCIISQDANAIEYFQKSVDSACVYVNTSTRFTDGFEFGFGAEIGISTQKLHTRGPMGLQALTSEKYLIDSKGKIRE